MGNHNERIAEHQNEQQSKKFRWLKKIKKVKQHVNKDNFIIKHKQNNKHIDQMIDIHSLDQRRYVFVSVIGLYQTWKTIPSIILNSSILLMPLKQQWLYDTTQHTNEIKTHFISTTSIFQDQKETKEFIELLKWKDSQGLVFWMLDKYESLHDNISESTNVPESEHKKKRSVAPFWHCINCKLSKLYDPITNGYYNSLILDTQWWINRNNSSNNKYCTNTKQILNELHFLNMKFTAIQEILTKSNPTLNVVKTYIKHSETLLTNNEIETVTPDIVCDENEEWYVSEYYDPYDMGYGV
eukprot:174769_1